LDATRVATGNQVRDAGLARALIEAGDEVKHCAPLPPDEEPGEHFYASAQELRQRIETWQPDAILVGYWNLLAQLPEVKVPVILDFIAPRLLEAMSQEPGALLHESRQILALLPRADHFLVGNARQADLLLSLLLL